MGYIITKKGVKPDPSKIKVAINIENLKNKKSNAVTRHGKILPRLMYESQLNIGTAYGINQRSTHIQGIHWMDTSTWQRILENESTHSKGEHP